MVEVKHQKLLENYDSLKQRIADHFPEFSKQLKLIARYVIASPDELALETVATIAQRIGVQPSSMVRFAQSLGFDGFSDMQQIFCAHLVNRSQNFAGNSYQERIDAICQWQSSSADIYSRVLGDFVEEGHEALSLLRDSTIVKNLEKAVSLFAAAENIYLVAQRRAFPVAYYIYYALGRLDQRTHLIDNIGGSLAQQTRMVTERDVLVAISFPAYSTEVVEVVSECKKSGAPIVVITDSLLSPIALESSLVFEIHQQYDQAFRSLVAPMCLAQSLVVSLGHVIAAKRNGITDAA